MYLYNKTLVAGSNINEVAIGHFLGNSEAQLAILRGTALSLYNLIDKNCYHIITMPLFGIGRCLKTLHLIDYYKDLLVLTSDSGCLTILEFDLESNVLKPIINHKFGNTGFQKETPAQYLQISPDNHYIAIGAIWENVLVFPVQYSLSVDRKQIQFDLSVELRYFSSKALIYDMIWFDDQTLIVYQADETTLEKHLISLSVQNGSITSSPYLNLTQVHPNEQITRIVAYDQQLLLLSKYHLILHTSSSHHIIQYPSPDSTITCSCITPFGLALGCDHGFVFYLPPNSQSFSVISPTFKYGGYSIQLCCTDTTLYIFYNNFYHSCILFSDIANPSSEKNPFSHCLYSLGYCNNLISLTTKTKSQHYLASLGSGESSSLAAITIGQIFNAKPVNLSKGNNITLQMDRTFCLPSLTNSMVDSYLVTSFVKETVIYGNNRLGNNTFEAIKTSPFNTKETTINAGVHHGVYIQITPSAIYALSSETCLGTWETTPDARIETSYVGNNTIIIVRKKQNILCLRWETDHFINLDEFISQSEVTCVFEMNDILLAGSRDRSIRVYHMDNNFITEKSYCLVDAIPRFLFSFATNTNPAYDNFKTANDNTIFVGCDEGCLVLMVFKKDTPELEIIQSSLIDTAKDTICLSASVFNHIPTLFIASNSVSYIVYRNAVFDFIPISVKRINNQSKEDLPTSLSSRNFNHGFAVFKNQDAKNIIFLWRRGQLFIVTCESFLPNSTVAFNSYAATCRSTTQCSNIYLSYFNDYPTSRNDRIKDTIIQGVYLNDSDVLMIVNYNHNCFANEILTAVTLCHEESVEYQEKKSYFIIGSMNLEKNEYYLSYCSVSEQVDGFKRNLSLKWKIKVEAKVFNIVNLSNQWVALVIGNLLRIIKVSQTGISFVNQIKCSSSFITSIHYEYNRFYLTDNSGVISIIAVYQNQLYYLLQHETNRSLMRSCVVDEITMAVSDKFGNLLIYRSLFPMDYLINTAQPSLADYRPTTSYSMSLIASYYIGELVTSLFMEELKNSMKVITYSTIYGTIGCLYPITNLNDLEVITGLESLIMGKGISLVGRIVDDFRSTYIPCLSIVDGNICKLFFQYSEKEQEEIASQLDMSVCEVKRKILEINNLEFKSQPKKGEEQ